MEDLEDALAEQGVAASSVRLVVLTHGHADHAGLAADLQRVARATIVLGEGDVPMASAGENDELRPTGFTGALLKPFIRSVYTPFVPDITVAVDHPLDLGPWGIDGKVVAMPGHTPGSVVVLLGDHTAFVGDVVAGGTWGGAFSPRTPEDHLYQANATQNRRNLQLLMDLGVTKLYLGHGGPLTRADVLAYLARKP
jgi:hydroxyacylglutathione hydrolase